MSKKNVVTNEVVTNVETPKKSRRKIFTLTDNKEKLMELNKVRSPQLSLIVNAISQIKGSMTSEDIIKKVENDLVTRQGAAKVVNFYLYILRRDGFLNLVTK